MAGDQNLDGVQTVVLNPQAKLLVDFLDAVLSEAIAHAAASVRVDHIAMLILSHWGTQMPRPGLFIGLAANSTSISGRIQKRQPRLQAVHQLAMAAEATGAQASANLAKQTTVSGRKPASWTIGDDNSPPKAPIRNRLTARNGTRPPPAGRPKSRPLDMQPFGCILSSQMDAVFKALADASRRELLDQLHKSNGQTLSELCAHLDMTRQAVTKHLVLLEEANLVATVWRGREKLHYLNPVPLQEIYERWIGKYERHRLQALGDLKKGLEANKSKKE
jgi:DNA-binding transcriptional ArsR family regulator